MGSEKAESEKTARLTRLDGERCGEIESFLIRRDADGEPVGEVRGDDVGLGPVEGPAVVDRDEDVVAGDDAVESEGTVGVGLITADEFSAGVGIAGDEEDHDAADAAVTGFGIASDGR